MEDHEIIELYFARDQRAIAETAARHGAFLFRLAHRFLRSPGDAEECVNDTYLRAWNAIPPTRPAALRTWLGRIIRNLALDRWDRAQAEKRGGSETELLLGELSDCLPAPGSPERQLEDQETARAISVFLRTLEPETRRIFLRRYWYGDRLAEIARDLGCREGTVKSSLFRTRVKLKDYLEREGIFI